MKSNRTESRTEIARELQGVAERLASRLEAAEADVPEVREIAARTLRTLSSTLVTMSEAADNLEGQRDQAIKMARDAANLAERVLPPRKKDGLS